MEQEFTRRIAWRDWKGVEYTLHAEWIYVNGPAVRAEGCTPGTRDDNYDGKTPEMFLEDTNGVSSRRRHTMAPCHRPPSASFRRWAG